MRLKEIEARLAAIQTEIEKRGAELSGDAIATLEAEVKALVEERAGIQSDAEKRTKLLADIAAGRAGATVRTFAEPTATPTPSAGAPGERRGAGEADVYDTPEYRRAFMAYVTRGTEIPTEYRADETTKTSDIGAVIPTTVLNKIVEKMEATGMILPLVTTTGYKGGVAIPTSTVKPVAKWVAEGATSEKQKKTTGSITFAYHKLRCAVSVTLETDVMALSAFESLLTNNVTEAMLKALEEAIITGDGIGKPKGILAETPATGQEVSSSAPSYQDLIEAEAALPLAYENGAVWCMTKKTFMAYYGLKDSEGQPIGRVNFGITGKPERILLGRPVTCCDYVASYAPALTADTVFAFLFTFKDYALNTNYQMTIKQYEDNDTDDQVTKAVMLADGKVVDKGSLVTIKKKA